MAESARRIPAIDYTPSHELVHGFEIRRLESVYERSGTLSIDPFAPHRVRFSLLIYIAEGRGTHFIDFEKYRYGNGSFLFINQNQVHAFDPKNRPVGTLCCFTEEFLESINTQMRLPSAVPVNPLRLEPPLHVVRRGVRESCEALLREITAVTGQGADDQMLVKLLLSALVLKLRSAANATPASRLSERRREHLRRFIAMVQNNLHTRREASAYSKSLGITYKTLNDCCKASVGKTPKQLVDFYTILEAKRRLVIDDAQISELAFELGFNEVTNFVKYFKKHTAETPSQFRERFLR